MAEGQNLTNLIDAAEQFDSRRRIAALPEVLQHSIDYTKVIGQQVDAFNVYLKHNVPDAYRVFDEQFALDCKVVIPPHNEVGEDSVVDGDYAVYESQGSKPFIIVESAAICQMTDYIDPLCSSFDIENPEALKTRMASAALGWMAVSKWLFDTLDPRDDIELQEEIYSTISMWLMRFAGIQADELDDSERLDKKIDGAMSLAKCRTMGAYGFVGMRNVLQNAHDDLVPENLIPTFKQLCVALGNKSPVNREHFSIMEYAMFHPCRESDANALLSSMAQLQTAH